MIDERVRLGAGLGAIVAGANGLRFAERQYAMDDAWISFRVARTWLEGGGLTFDGARPAVEGMSNLLWTLLSAGWIAALPSVDPMLPMRLLGGACAVAAAWTAGRAAAALCDGPSAALAAAAASLAVGANGGFLYSAVSGLETGLWVLLVGGGAAASLLGRVRGGAALLGLAVWCRPEGALAGLAVAAALALRDRRGGLTIAAAVTASLMALTVWRWSTYGALVPNTFHAKPPDPMGGLAYLGAWLLVAGAPLALALRGAPRVGWELAGVAGVMAAGVAWSGGDWMPGWRRLGECGWVLAVLIGGAAGRGRVGAVALGIWLVGQGWWAWRGEDSGAWYHGAVAAVGERAQGAGLGSVAATDIGRLGWVFTGSIYDLAGLTDAHIGGRDGGVMAKAWDEAYFRERGPELVILTSASPPEEARHVPVEADARRSLEVNGGYAYLGAEQVAARGWLLLYLREDIVDDAVVQALREQ